MVTEDQKIEKSIKAIEKIQKTFPTIKLESYNFKEKRFQELKESLEKAKKWQLVLFHDIEENVYSPSFTSKTAKEIIENFHTFEAKHEYEELEKGLKISKMTHHSFCNVPVIAGPVGSKEERTDKVLFYPVDKLITEEEYTYLKTSEKKKKFVIDILKIYQDLALNKPLLYKLERIEINKDLIEIPENLEDIDLTTIKAQASAIQREEIKNKVKVKDRTAVYKEFHPVDSYEILSECTFSKDKASVEIMDENGEFEEFDFLYYKRPVAYTLFGIGFEKKLGWFPCTMVINIFKRKDILSKKSSPEEYKEKHTYHLNGKKLQVNYKNLYLKGIYGIENTPALWSYASLTANDGKLNITIPIPIQRKVKNKETEEIHWQRTAPKSLSRAVSQILGTEKITYKETEIYLPGKRAWIEKELIDIKDPSWLEDAESLIKKAVSMYKALQTIKRGIDFIEENVEDISEIAEFVPVKEIVKEIK